MNRHKRTAYFNRGLFSLAVAGISVWLLAGFSLRPAPERRFLLPQSVDVVVAGSGPAAAAAALTAAQAGAEVFYLDLTGEHGTGFPAFSPAFWAAGTPYQQGLVPAYTAAVMTEAVYGQGEGYRNRAQIEALSIASADSLAWLEKLSGVAFSVLAAPDTNPGLHLPAGDEAGNFLLPALRAALEPLLAGSLRPVNTPEINHTRDGWQITVSGSPDGRKKQIRCQAIIFADGGFASNSRLLREYTGLSDVEARPEGGHAGTGLSLLLAAGARARELEAASLLTVFLPQGRRFDPALHREAILLNADGAKMPGAEEAAPGEMPAYVVHSGGRHQDVQGFVYVENLQVLASGLGIREAALVSSLEGLLPPYSVAALGTVALLPGGIEVDEHYRVIGAGGPIPGLYAAGELTAGIHGRSSITELVLAEEVTSGRLAGWSAARYAQR
jgi:fumarate reductase flavoprotein subunit